MDKNKNRRKTPARRKRTPEQIRRDTMQAKGVLAGLGLMLVAAIIYFSFFRGRIDRDKDSSSISTETLSNASLPDETPDTINESTPPAQTTAADSDLAEPVTTAAQPEQKQPLDGHKLEVRNGITYVDGIMIVNKTYSLPSTYDPGLDPTAEAAFNEMANDAYAEGIGLFICSGYRSYQEQKELYNDYAAERGTEEADRVSSRPGHSEHQSGLSMDINTTEFDFAGTPEAIWLANHCADYGFIVRFPLGKEDITGYAYEPWHIRYVGKKAAQEIFEQDICLEEYLGVTSDYKFSKDYS